MSAKETKKTYVLQWDYRTSFFFVINFSVNPVNVTVPCVNREPRFSLSEMKKKWEKDRTKRKVVLFVCSWWGKSASEIHGGAANSRIIFQGNSTRINPFNPRVREGKHARKLLVSVAGPRRCWISSFYLFFFFFTRNIHQTSGILFSLHFC